MTQPYTDGEKYSVFCHILEELEEVNKHQEKATDVIGLDFKESVTKFHNKAIIPNCVTMELEGIFYPAQVLTEETKSGMCEPAVDGNV